MDGCMGRMTLPVARSQRDVRTSSGLVIRFGADPSGPWGLGRGSAVLAVLCHRPPGAAGPLWGPGLRTACRRCITSNMHASACMASHVACQVPR
jgi:hypothetical protein